MGLFCCFCCNHVLKLQTIGFMGDGMFGYFLRSYFLIQCSNFCPLNLPSSLYFRICLCEIVMSHHSLLAHVRIGNSSSLICYSLTNFYGWKDCLWWFELPNLIINQFDFGVLEENAFLTIKFGPIHINLLDSRRLENWMLYTRLVFCS